MVESEARQEVISFGTDLLPDPIKEDFLSLQLNVFLTISLVTLL